MDWDRPWPRPEITPEFLEDDVVLVAEEDGEIVGTAFGEPARHGRAHLNIACVRTEWRGRGGAEGLGARVAAPAPAAGAAHRTLDGAVSNAEGGEGAAS